MPHPCGQGHARTPGPLNSPPECREVWSADDPTTQEAPVHDLEPFAIVVAVAAIALLGAAASSRISEWTRVPTPSWARA